MAKRIRHAPVKLNSEQCEILCTEGLRMLQFYQKAILAQIESIGREYSALTDADIHFHQMQAARQDAEASLVFAGVPSKVVDRLLDFMLGKCALTVVSCMRAASTALKTNLDLKPGMVEGVVSEAVDRNNAGQLIGIKIDPKPPLLSDRTLLALLFQEREIEIVQYPHPSPNEMDVGNDEYHTSFYFDGGGKLTGTDVSDNRAQYEH